MSSEIKREIIDEMIKDSQAQDHDLQNNINALNGEIEKIKAKIFKAEEERKSIVTTIKALLRYQQNMCGAVGGGESYSPEDSSAVEADNFTDIESGDVDQEDKDREKTISEIIREEAIKILEKNHDRQYTCKELIKLMPSGNELEKRSANLSHLVYQAMRKNVKVQQTDTKPLRFFIPKKEAKQL